MATMQLPENRVRPLAWIRQRIRSSEAWFIALATLVGAAAGLVTIAQGVLARFVQHSLFGLPANTHLSAVGPLSIGQLLVLPVGGLVLGLFTFITNRQRSRRFVDAVEANALHGGRMSIVDSLIISAQTLISNGFGASVGLEAAYAQLGAASGSVVGTRSGMRRNDVRTLVGAGAGAAIAAAFGAPLTGAFYAFEIVIGAYTPSAIAPVAGAALAGALVSRGLGVTPYIVAVSSGHIITTADYALYTGLGAICAVTGIALMRLVAMTEGFSRSVPMPRWLRPAIGGLLLMPIAALSSQTISSGHAALSLDLLAGTSLGLLAAIFLLKSAASIVSLGFGFRGGLFFASLFLGSLLGHGFADALALTGLPATLDVTDAALVGMAALAVAVVGGPFTMALLVLEATHDFALTGVVIAAVLVSSTIVRVRFGYSFSTWRLHLRGETLHSARDVGWIRSLTAATMMRRDTQPTLATTTVAAFRERFPLGSISRVVLVDAEGHYAGIVIPAMAYEASLADLSQVAALAVQRDLGLKPDANIIEVMQTLDRTEADELAVLAPDNKVLGILSEKYVRRRYVEELEMAQRDLFGEHSTR